MNNEIIVVSGLPRSGTSLMMQILSAGEIPILTDFERNPDDNNPKGYYEFKKVKNIAVDSSWIKNAIGKAVKIVSPFLRYLPKDYKYKIIFMERDLVEVIASQEKMTGEKSGKDLIEAFKNHLLDIKMWLKRQKNIEVIFINYRQLVNNPLLELEKIGLFLNFSFPFEKLSKVIDKNLCHFH